MNGRRLACMSLCVAALCKGCRFHLGICMLALSKFLFTALALGASVPVMAADVRQDTGNTIDEIGSKSYVASYVAVADDDGYGSARSTATASHVTRVNRALWENSFDHGSNASTAMFTASQGAAPISSTSWAALKVGYGGRTWPIFSNSLYTVDIQNGLYRKPGIGACLLAALAITGLAVSRRRTGHHPIVPPRQTFDARISANGAQ